MFWFHDAEVFGINLEAQSLQARVLIDTSPLSTKGHELSGSFHFFDPDDAYVITVATEVQ